MKMKIRIPKVQLPKASTNTRIYLPDKYKIKEFTAELTGIQKRPVTSPELIRRVLNSNEIKDLLRKDAEAKRRMGL